MLAIWTIFRREMIRYFTSLVPYLVAATFLLLTALAFYEDLTLSVTVRSTFPDAVPSFLTLALIFFAPILTMRALAEEKREGTLELLLTAPVTDTAIVLGKFLSAWVYYTLLLLIAASYQIMLIVAGQTPDLGHAIAAHLGVWLYGGASLAIGIMFSATTENQIVAAFLSSSALTLLFLANQIGEILPNVFLANIIRGLSFQGHFAGTFAAGIVRLEDIVYFVGATIIALFISTRAIQAQRMG
jgi:ABC-2 type transport system permease protein